MKFARRSVVLGGMSAAVGLLPKFARADRRRLILQCGSPSPNSGFIPFYVSQQLGFFSEEGLDVDIRYTRGATVAMQLLSAGQADVGFFVYDTLIAGYDQGMRGTYFYQYYNKPIFLIGYPASGNIKSVGDLLGKRIGVASLGSVGVAVAKSILRTYKLDPSSVTFVPIGVGNQAMIALERGQVDAVCYWDAPFGTLEELGAKLNYIEHPKLKNIGSGGYVAAQRVFNERPDDLMGFGRAIAKATAFVLKNPEAGIRIYWKVNPAGKPEGAESDAMEKALVETKFIFNNMRVDPAADHGRPVFGKIDLGELQQYIDVTAVELGLKQSLRADQIADPKLVAKINEFDLGKINTLASSWAPG